MNAIHHATPSNAPPHSERNSVSLVWIITPPAASNHFYFVHVPYRPSNALKLNLKTVVEAVARGSNALKIGILFRFF